MVALKNDRTEDVEPNERVVDTADLMSNTNDNVSAEIHFLVVMKMIIIKF